MSFDPDQAFDDDYLHFYEPYTTDERNADETALIASLCDLAVADRVLDLACGTGRIANRLAMIGCDVTGLDRSASFLERARAEAEAAGLASRFVEADMRQLDYQAEFDAVLHWFTSFGYFDDPTLRDQLARIRRALRPGGRLLLETLNLHQVLLDDEPQSVRQVGADLMIDQSEYDPVSGRIHYQRTIARHGRPRRSFEFSMRLFTAPELCGWLRDAGFAEVEAFGGEGEAFGLESERLVLLTRA